MGYSAFRLHVSEGCKIDAVPLVNVEESGQLTACISCEDAVRFQFAFRGAFLVHGVVFPENMRFLNKLVYKRCRVSCFFGVIQRLTFFENHLHVRRGNSYAVHYGVSWVAVRYLAGETFSFAFQNQNRPVPQRVPELKSRWTRLQCYLVVGGFA